MIFFGWLMFVLNILCVILNVILVIIDPNIVSVVLILVNTGAALYLRSALIGAYHD